MDTAAFVRFNFISISEIYFLLRMIVFKGTPGFTGQRCEYCDACTPNPCQNGGQCQSSGITGGFRCICPPGFLGRLCEDRDPCFNNGPCGAYGRCVATIDGNAKCECQSGYTGATCQMSIMSVFFIIS